jgi:hypothetical protein
MLEVCLGGYPVREVASAFFGDEFEDAAVGYCVGGFVAGFK